MTEEAKLNYRIRLNASINCDRFLLKQGLSFRGNDESDGSSNRDNFVELLKFLSDNNEEINKVVLTNAPENCKLIHNSIQKEIVRSVAFHISKAITRELDGGLFCILIDESRDVSIKEQMAVVLRFVDKKGCLVERFWGVERVSCTTSASLKVALENLFYEHSLSVSMLWGQGYNGASNMQGEYNGLKSLILKEGPSTYYVHCFSHQLQLALVAVARNHTRVEALFLLITEIVNVVGASCKRVDALRDKQAKKIVDALENEEIMSGQGLNQEKTLIRPCDTRWGSQYRTLDSLICLFDSVIDVLDDVVEEGRSARKSQEVLCSHHYRVELFNTVIDMQLQELNNRFNEANTELLLCVACFDPCNSFAAFDKKKLIRLAELYLKDFSDVERLTLGDQLENFILDMRLDTTLTNIKGLSGVSQKMVETRRNKTYPLVYKLLCLALILPVAIASVERALSAMKLLKTRLRNRMSDQFMNDCMLAYIERDIFSNLSNEDIIDYFQNMGTRRGQL